MKTITVHANIRILKDGIAALGAAQFVKQLLGGAATGVDGQRAFEAAGDRFFGRYAETHPEMNDNKPMTPEQAREWLMALAHEMIRVLEAA